MIFTLSEPEVHNHYPNCVTLKLHLNSVPLPEEQQSLPEVGGISSERILQELELGLTINFNGKQKLKVPAGKRLGLPDGEVVFGIRRGKLQFELDKCRMPLEKIDLTKPFSISFEVEIESEEVNETQAGVSSNKGTGLIKSSRKSAQKRVSEYFSVKHSGSENSPAWFFEIFELEPFLEGILKEARMGVIELIGSPSCFKADFLVDGDDICITKGQWGWSGDIVRNKTAIIERALVLRYLIPKLESSPLSEVRWNHG